MDRKPPRYLEAFPRFNLRSAMKSRSLGLDLCVFEQGTGWVGQARIDALGEESVTVRYFLSLPEIHGGAGNGILILKVRRTPNPVHRAYQCACPACDRWVEDIVWAAKHWGCRHCHKLPYASQVEAPFVLLGETFRRLCDEVLDGRPKHMRQATYVKKRKMMVQTRRKLSRMKRVQRGDATIRYVRGVWYSSADVAGDNWLADLPSTTDG